MRRLRRRARAHEPESFEPSEPYSPDLAPGEDEAEIRPFVPVSGEYRGPDDEGVDLYVPVPEERRRLQVPRPRLPRPHLPRPRLRLPALGVEIRLEVLLAILALIVGGVFGTLVNLGRVSGQAQDWWPAAIIVAAVLWMVAALIRRRIASSLGGAALAGIGLSLLLDTQQIASGEETLMGVVLITVGLGIAIRGLLLRGHTAA